MRIRLWTVLSKTIANRHLEDQILDVRVPVETVYELRANGTKKAVREKYSRDTFLLIWS